MAAGPSIELLDGQLSIDLSAMASSEVTLLTSYISSSSYQFALRMTGFFSITDFLNTIPGVRAAPPAAACYSVFVQEAVVWAVAGLPGADMLCGALLLFNWPFPLYALDGGDLSAGLLRPPSCHPQPPPTLTLLHPLRGLPGLPLTHAACPCPTPPLVPLLPADAGRCGKVHGQHVPILLRIHEREAGVDVCGEAVFV
jgi:hypothetical protein